MRVGLFTFGSTRIGMGHIARCLALAALAKCERPDAEIAFELGEHPEAAQLVRERMPEGRLRRWSEGALPEGKWDVLVVDRLQMPPEAMAALKARSACLVSIDDNGPGRWLADIAVNPLYAPVAERPADSTTHSLVGIAHSLIQPAFTAHRHLPRTPPASVLLTQGAGDPHGLLPAMVEALAPMLRPHSALTLHVLTGSSFRADEVLDRALADAAIPTMRHRSVADPAPLLATMDLAVTSIGVTACELACLGVPLLLVTGEAKELETAAMLEKAGAGLAFGRFAPGRAGELAAACAVLLDSPERLRAMGEQGRRAVDGRASERIVRMALELAEGRKQRENAL